MTGFGLSLLSHSMLELSPHGEDWYLVLRRADFTADQRFAACHGRDLGPHDVAQFVPRWETLFWVPVPDSLLSRSESRALDQPYQIHVCANAGSPKRHRDVIDAFARFMRANAQP